MRKSTRYILLIGVLGITAIFIGLLVWLGIVTDSSLPDYSGELSVNGLSQPAEVLFDEYGIPTIIAQNTDDLFMVQGYITAQDRLWQMDLSRRNAAGKLAELFGPMALDMDRLFRSLELSQLASRIVATLPLEQRAVLERYAAGINQYIETHRDKLPWEFRLLQYQPAAWRPEDTILTGKLLNWRLSRTYQTDLMRQELFAKLGEEAARLLPEKSLFDFYLYNTPPDFPAMSVSLPAPSENRPLAWFSEFPRHPAHSSIAQGAIDCGTDVSLGSNNWVLSGTRTKSGKPILANDPHLWHSLPSIWYAVQLHLPDRKLAGVSLPGAPGIIIGHNEQVAWAVTNVEADVQDLYLVEFSDESSSEYFVDGAIFTADKSSETIVVRDSEPVSLEIFTTRFGPVIERRGKQARALRWTGLEPISELQTFLQLMAAKNWDDFRAALSVFPGPPQNFLFADHVGNIGYSIGGLFPVRRGFDGTRPISGATKNHDWQGWVPVEELPQVYNPASGWLATANNRMVDDRYPYVLTKHWAPAYRFNRIRTLLEARKTFTAVDMTQIQTDTYSYPDAALAKEIVKTIQKARVRSADEELVLNELDVWDGHVRRSSLAATLTWYTRIALEELILRSKLGDKLAGSYRWMQSPVFLQELLQSQDPSWLPTRTVKISLDSPETFQSRLITGYEDLKRVALAIAMSYLRREYGQTPGDKWRWGVANSMQFAHPLGKIWPLNQLLNSPRIELEGNSWTVSVNRPDFGASMRLVVDFSDTSKTYLHITTGQSGHFRSHHYLDQLPLWNSGRVISLSQSDRIAQSSGGTLKLIPFPMR